MQRFADWTPYYLKCGAVIQGQFTPTPFNFKTIDQFYSMELAFKLKRRLIEYFKGRSNATVVDVLDSSDDIIREYGEFLFKNDYSIYTAKQWGISPDEVDPSILKRVPIRFSYDEGYFDDEFQVMPAISYNDFFKNILNHPNININLQIDALDYLKVDNEDKQILVNGKVEEDLIVIFTGALDELFGLDSGRLPYRSLKFEWHYEIKIVFSHILLLLIH